jgi:sporulation protein YlmC with PRC-barrel domain
MTEHQQDAELDVAQNQQDAEPDVAPQNQQDAEPDVAPQNQQDAEPEVAEHQEEAEWNVAEWHGRMLVDRNGERIGKLQDVYVDVETDEPQFATVKEGFIGRHLTFVPLGGIKVGPESLEAAVSRQQVQDAPNIEQHGEELSQADESSLYHHYELNYTPPKTESGRRLARR